MLCGVCVVVVVVVVVVCMWFVFCLLVVWFVCGCVLCFVLKSSLHDFARART